MPKTYAGIYQEYLKTCEKQGGTFSPNTLRSDFIKNGFEVKDLNNFERLVLFMNYLSDGFPDLAEKFNAQLGIDHLGEYGPMQEKAMMMMLEENIIHSNTDFINEVLVDPEVEKHFWDKGLQNLYETTAAMIGGKELEQLKNKDKKEPEISADRERQPEPRPDTGEKREEKEPEPEPETEKKYAFRSMYELAKDGERLRGNLKRMDPRFDIDSMDAPEFGTNLNTPMEKLIFVGQMARYAERQENIDGRAPDESLREISRVILESNGGNALALKGTLQKKLFANLNYRSLLKKDLDLAEKFFEGSPFFENHPEKKQPLRDLLDEVKASIELVRDDPARQDLTKAPVEKAPEQPAAAERQPDRKSEEIAADMREKDLPVGEDKWRKIGETLCADEPTRMYYYGALKTVLRQVGMTEEELRVNNSERFKNTRSSEFYNMIHPVCMALDNLKDGSYGNIAGQLKILKTGCINYLNKYPKVRSTQSGRDCYEAALNLLATCADPNDPEVKACIDGVNAKRGLANRPSAKDHIDLRSYGPDRLLGNKKGAAELLKDTDKELVAQAKLAKRGDETARAQVKRLQLKKLYIKASVAPNNAAYPDQLDNTVSVLAANTELNRVLAEAAKDPKRQEQIMAAEVNKLAGRRERNDFYEKAPGAPQAQNGEPKKEKDPSARERLGEFFNI